MYIYWKYSSPIPHGMHCTSTTTCVQARACMMRSWGGSRRINEFRRLKSGLRWRHAESKAHPCDRCTFGWRGWVGSWCCSVLRCPPRSARGSFYASLGRKTPGGGPRSQNATPRPILGANAGGCRSTKLSTAP